MSARPETALRHDLSVEEFQHAYDEGWLSLDTSHLFSIAPRSILPAPPDARSTAYREWVLATWRQLTGRDSYEPDRDEQFDLDIEAFVVSPFPLNTHDPVEVGHYFGAISWFLTEVQPRRGDRVVELGSGWGHLALMLASIGLDVTAVDLNPASVEVLRRRASNAGLDITVAQQAFLDFEARDIDLAVFFESFHHCDDPLRLLDRTVASLTDTGRIAFLAEAVYDDFYCPWGVRLDGSATFMTRKAGWLELGFDRSFFYRELNARGMAIDDQKHPHLAAYGSLIVARHADDGNVLAGLLAPDEQATWDDRVPSIAPARLARERSAATIPSGELGELEVRLSNLSDSPLRASIRVGQTSATCLVDQGDHCTVRMALEPGQRLLEVSSDLAESAALGLPSVGLAVEGISIREQR